MAWVANAAIGGYVWDMGLYLPVSPSLLSWPREDLFPADAGEVYFMLVDAAVTAAGVAWSDEQYHSYLYIYSGGGFNWRDDTVATDGLKLLVVFYNLNYDDPVTMPFVPSITAPQIVPASYSAMGAAPPPPAAAVNDNFADRIAISAQGSFAVDPLWGTREVGEDYYGVMGHTAWWEWTADEAGVMHIHAIRDEEDGNASDLVTAIYRASVAGVGVLPAHSPGPEVWVSANSTPTIGGGFQVIRNVAVGDVFYFQVDHVYGKTGSVSFEVVQPPVNDDYANRIFLTGATGSVAVDTTNATIEPGEAGLYQGESVWYDWLCPATDRYFFQPDTTLSGGVFLLPAVVLNVRTSLGSAEVPSIIQEGGRKTFDAVAGTHYMLQVAAGSSHTGTIAWGAPVPVANDAYADRVVLSGTSGSADFTLLDTNHDIAPYDAPNGDVWYEWTAPDDTPVQLTITNPDRPLASTNYWTVGLFEVVRRVVNPSMPVGTPQRNGASFYPLGVPLGIAGADGWGLVFNPVAGKTYLIALYTNYGAPSTGTLHWAPIAANTALPHFGDWYLGSGEATVAEFDTYQSHYGAQQGTAPVIGIGVPVWTRYKSSFTGTLHLEAYDYEPELDYDWPGIAVAVYSGPDNALTPAALILVDSASAPAKYSADAGVTLPSAPLPRAVLEVAVTAGQTYYIQRDYVSFSARISRLAVTAIAPPPANDNIASATDLGSSLAGASAVMSTIGATTEPYPGVDDLSGDVARTVWAKWTVPSGNIRDMTFTKQGPTGPTSYKAYVAKVPSPTTFADLGLLGTVLDYQSAMSFRVAPGQQIYLRASTPTGQADARSSFSWAMDRQYIAGPWILPGPVVYAAGALVPQYPGDSGQPGMVFDSNSRFSQWVIDQPFGGVINPYDYPDARQCAFDHCKAGDMLDHYDWGWTPGSCAVGHFNDAFVGGSATAGLVETWDHGGGFVASFYDMSLSEYLFRADLSHALQAWLPGPTSGLDSGQIVETQADPLGYSTVFSDQTGTSLRMQVQVDQYKVQVSGGSAVVENSLTLHLAAGNLVSKAYQGGGSFGVPPAGTGYVWVDAGPLGNQLATQVLSAGETVVAPMVSSPRAGADLQHDPLEGTDLPLLPYAAYDMWFFASGFHTEGAPPGTTKTWATGSSQVNQATATIVPGEIVVQPNAYRVLTPIDPLAENWDFPIGWFDPDFPDPSWDDATPSGTTRVRFARAVVHARAEFQLPLASPWNVPTYSDPWEGTNDYGAVIPAGQGIRRENWAVFEVPEYLVVRGNAEPLPELLAVSHSALVLPSGAISTRPARTAIDPGLASRWLPDVGYGTDWTANDGRKWLAGNLPTYTPSFSYAVSPSETLSYPALHFRGNYSLIGSTGEHWLKSDPATWDDATAFSFAMVLKPRHGWNAFYGLLESQRLAQPNIVATTWREHFGLRMQQDLVSLYSPARVFQQRLQSILVGTQSPLFLGISLDCAAHTGHFLALGHGRVSGEFALPSIATKVASDLYLGRAAIPANPALDPDPRYLAAMLLLEMNAGPVALSFAQLNLMASKLDSVYGITG